MGSDTDTDSDTITVSLGKQKAVLDELLRLGRFASASEALQAGVAALQQQELIFDDELRAELRARVDSTQSRIPAAEARRQMWEHMETSEKAAKRGA
jgi:Arc/MetJ-type ribon-helix-helix transcriptional regulator